MLKESGFLGNSILGLVLIVAFVIAGTPGWAGILSLEEKQQQRNANTLVYDAAIKDEKRAKSGIDNSESVFFRIIQKGDNLSYNAGSVKSPDWRISNPLFEKKGGYFVSEKGRHKIKLPVILGPRKQVLFQVDSHRFKTTPDRLIYFDRESEAIRELGYLKDSEGILSGPVVTYKNPFTSISCDLRYTNARGFFKQDLILHELPPDPSEYGLNADTTVLVVLTEIDDFNDYLGTGIKAFRCGPRGKGILNALGFSESEDGSIVFYSNDRGELQFLHALDRGIAYQEFYGSEKVAAIPVKKKIWRDGKDCYLWEEVPWSYLSRAHYPVVIDYSNRSGILSENETWSAGPMYLLQGQLTLADGVTLTIDPGSVIKIQDDGGFSGIQVTGDGSKLLAVGTARAPITFTSSSDNSIGEPVVGGDPVAAAGDYENAIELGWNCSTGSKVEYCEIGYARRGIEVSGSLDNPVFSNQVYEATLSGIRAWSADTAAISVDLVNNLITGVSGVGIGVSGGMNGEKYIYNNTVDGCQHGLEISALPGTLTIVNNLFSNCATAISAQTDQVINDYNGYFNNATNVTGLVVGANDVNLAESPYEGGDGWYYIDQDCALIDGGAWSTESAGLAGFFTNLSDYPRESDEGVVDIGYHYPTFDADNDGMPDEWEALYALDPYLSSDAAWDLDTDGYSNVTEYRGESDPTIDGSVPRRYIVRGGDFDGDGDMESAVVRITSNGNRYWYLSGIGTWDWGMELDYVVPGDYNGDGTTDLATWRPTINKWLIKDQTTITWGSSVDCFVPGDYNGDGTTDCTTWRPKVGRWFIYGITKFYLGDNSDIPVPGRYTGDGATLAAVWNPSDGEWHVRNLTVFNWGEEGDLPFPADFDGDGTDEYVCFSPETGNSYGLRWNVRHANGSTLTMYHGFWGDIPASGDYDGDGCDDVRVYRPSDGTWYTLSDEYGYQYGTTGDQPLSGYLRGSDSDFDGLPDDWEEFYFGNLSQNPQDDHPDYDGIDNISEYRYGSSPLLKDTDGDGLTDYEEIVTYGTNPTLIDTDEDSYSDGDEVADGSDPLDAADGPGMLINPGFEIWDASFSAATGWVWDQTASQWSAASDNPYQGKYSGTLNREVATSGNLYQYGISMTEDVEYFASVMVHGTGSIRVGIKYPEGDYVHYGAWNILTAAPWTLIEHSKAPSSSGTNGGIKLQVYSCSDGGLTIDNAYLDDEPLIPQTTPVPTCTPIAYSPGSVVINEVVTAPCRDWNDSTAPQAGYTPFDASPGNGEINNEDEWLEFYNTQPPGESAPIDLTGWTLTMSDMYPATMEFGNTESSVIYRFSSEWSSLTSFESQYYLVVGDPPGAMENTLLIELKDGWGTLIDTVELGDDPEDDGTGDGAPDGSSLGGWGSSTSTEAVARVPNATDSDPDEAGLPVSADVADFVRQAASIGIANPSPAAYTSGCVVINEFVLNPRTDWNDSSGGNGIPFDSWPGTGDITFSDKWVELFNVHTGEVDLSGWMLEASALDPPVTRLQPLGSGGAVFRFSAGGSIGAYQPGEYLTIGNPGWGFPRVCLLQLYDALGNLIDSVEVGDDPEDDGLGDGAPRGLAQGGASTCPGDESIYRYPDGMDTDVDNTDFYRGAASIGQIAFNPQTVAPGEVLINEVVTDPRCDWNDSSNGNGIPFDATVGDGPIDSNDQWIELYNNSAASMDLSGWTIEMLDHDSYYYHKREVLGEGNAVLAFSGFSTLTDFGSEDYLVVGNPFGFLKNQVVIELRDRQGTVVDMVELGDDPADDGIGNGSPDGDPYGGKSSDVFSEAIARLPGGVDTGNHPADFTRQSASIGAVNFAPMTAAAGSVLINEVVTNPLQDWSDSTGGNGIPFDSIPGSGYPATGDEWIELYNASDEALGLAGWRLTAWSGDTVVSIESFGGGYSSFSFSPGSALYNLQTGSCLVVGDPYGALPNRVYLQLHDPAGNLIDDVELGDDPEGDGTGDGAPGGDFRGGYALGIPEESVARFPNAHDEDDDAADFIQRGASIGVPNPNIPPEPVITSISPSEGYQIGGTPVIIRGWHFGNEMTTTAWVGETTLISLSVPNSREIRGVTGWMMFTGLVDVYVETAGQEAQANGIFESIGLPGSIEPDGDGDNDGLSDAQEAELGTFSDQTDSDDDGLEDGVELTFWEGHFNSATDDCDNDYTVNILDYDSDNDGISDGAEVAAGTDPCNSDTAPPVLTIVLPQPEEVFD